MFFFAYDGSINGDWVSHYASRLAAQHPDKTLHLVHVPDGTFHDELTQKLARIRTECGWHGVELDVRIEAPAKDVFAALKSSIPVGEESYLVCGTRVHERRRGLLSGTISERFLRSGHCNVLAIRVVQPGLLGLPRRLLLPVSGRPEGFRLGLPFLTLFGPDVSHMDILFVEKVRHFVFRLMSHPGAEKLRARGQAYCARVEREISEELGIAKEAFGDHVVVSDDVAKEIIIAANRTKARLIYMGASERNLPQRFFYGNPIEQVLRGVPCDAAIYRAAS